MIAKVTLTAQKSLPDSEKVRVSYRGGGSPGGFSDKPGGKILKRKKRTPVKRELQINNSKILLF